MHICSVCRNPCACGADLSTVVVRLHELVGCTCCINRCEHGHHLNGLCPACIEAEGAPITSRAADEARALTTYHKELQC